MAHIRNSRSAKPGARAAKRSSSDAHDSGRPAASGAGRAPAHIRSGRRRPGGLATRTPRQQRATQTVEAMVSAAAKLLVERGYAAASTNLIAERAGVSIGSLYQYFRHKDDIFAAVIARHRQQVEPVVSAILARMKAPGTDVI